MDLGLGDSENLHPMPNGAQLLRQDSEPESLLAESVQSERDQFGDQLLLAGSSLPNDGSSSAGHVSARHQVRTKWEEYTSKWILQRQRWAFWIQTHGWSNKNWFGTWSPYLIEINTLEFLSISLLWACMMVFGISSVFGTSIALSFGLCVLLISRHNVITTLTGIGWERLVKYHRWFAYMALVPTIIHGYYQTWPGNHCMPVPEGGIPQHDDHDHHDAESGDHTHHLERRHDHDGPCYQYFWIWGPMGTTGFITVCIFVTIVLLSLPIIRRRFFDFFYLTHFLFIALLVMAVVHARQAGKIMALAVALYVIDKVLRFLNTKTATITHVKHFDDDVVKITFRKPFHYLPGQFAYYHVGNHQHGLSAWHPLSFSSTPLDGEHASVTLRARGGWTRRLAAQLQHGRIHASTSLNEDRRISVSSFTSALRRSFGHDRDTAMDGLEMVSHSSETEHEAEDVGKGTGYCAVNTNGNGEGNLPRLFISGPYGTPSIPNLELYDGLLLIGGGIGITPLMSHYLTLDPHRRVEVEDVLYHTNRRAPGALVPLPAHSSDDQHRRHLHAVRLLWSVKHESAIEWFRDELQTMALSEQESRIGQGKGSNRVRNLQQERLMRSGEADDSGARRRSMDDNDRSSGPAWDASCKVFVTRQHELSDDLRNVQQNEHGFEAFPGRPDLRREVESFTKQVITDSDRDGRVQRHDAKHWHRADRVYIAVFVCGPASQMAKVNALVRSMRNDAVEYHLHAETFEM
eukprot:Clim_evm5s215 gene=Clim_evmTU5s215